MTPPLVQRCPEAIDRRAGTEVLVVRGGSNEVARLSGPAAIVWNALTEPASRHELVVRLAPGAPKGIDVDRAVGAGLDALLAAGLVTHDPS